MKYLKRFNESNSDDFYEEICRIDWNILASKRIKVEDSYKKIEDKVFDIFKEYQPEAKIAQAGMRIILKFGYNSKIMDIGIDVLPDEWFLVHINCDYSDYSFYKCDQLEGLFRFLEDKSKNNLRKSLLESDMILKKFNESNSEWYEKISYDEYMEWTSSNGQYGKPSEFTDSEVSVIKSCLSKTDRFKLLRNGPASNNPKGELISIGLSPYGSWYNKKVKSSLTITKYTDEWFLCQVDDSFYKCDQLEGLSKLIKDTNSINIFVDQFLKEDITLDSEYYESITLDDYRNFIQSNGDKLEVFSKNDVTYLRSGNQMRYYNDILWMNDFNLTLGDYVLIISRPCSLTYNNYGWVDRLHIRKYNDEWFYCQVERITGKKDKQNIYYKCDGLEGVRKLISKL